MGQTGREAAGRGKGHLVIELGGDGPRVLFADGAARALTGLTLEQLLAAEPEQAARGLTVEEIGRAHV